MHRIGLATLLVAMAVPALALCPGQMCPGGYRPVGTASRSQCFSKDLCTVYWHSIHEYRSVCHLAVGWCQRG